MTIDTQKLAADIKRMMEKEAKRTQGEWCVVGSGGDAVVIITSDGVGKSFEQLENYAVVSSSEWTFIEDGDTEFIANSSTHAEIIRQQGEVIRELYKVLSISIGVVNTFGYSENVQKFVFLEMQTALALLAPLVEGE